MVKVHTGALELSLRLAPPIGSSSREILETTLKRLRNEAKDSGTKNSRHYWKRFFLIRDAFASLGPAAVLTVHRSQGSSFDEVFVAPDVFWPNDIRLRKQLVYVAVSRARKAVWLVGETENQKLKNNWEEVLQ